MNMDLTFLTDSYTQQILQQLRNVREQEEKKRGGFRFDDILSARESASEVVSAKEKEERTARRQMYFVQSKEAAERRRLEMQNAIKHRMMTEQIRLDLTGERGVLTDRGTDWISALAYMGGFLS